MQQTCLSNLKSRRIVSRMIKQRPSVVLNRSEPRASRGILSRTMMDTGDDFDGGDDEIQPRGCGAVFSPVSFFHLNHHPRSHRVPLYIPLCCCCCYGGGGGGGGKKSDISSRERIVKYCTAAFWCLCGIGGGWETGTNDTNGSNDSNEGLGRH